MYLTPGRFFYPQITQINKIIFGFFSVLFHQRINGKPKKNNPLKNPKNLRKSA
jgi:hypothetical protein